jgi:hypothetical protein
MRILAMLSVVGLAVVGCSKEDDEAFLPPPDETLVEGAEGGEQAPDQAQVPAAQLQEDLHGVSASLEAQDYEGALTTLGAMEHVPMTPAQQQAYQLQLFQTMEYLRQKAQTDEDARKAYQRLSHQMMGR